MSDAAKHDDVDFDDDDRVSVPVAAKLLGVSATKMHELLDKRRIPYEVPDKQRRVKLSDVKRYRDSRTHRAAAGRERVEDLLSD